MVKCEIVSEKIIVTFNMRLYKELRICRVCKERFVVTPEKKREYFCDKCQTKFAEENSIEVPKKEKKAKV